MKLAGIPVNMYIINLVFLVTNMTLFYICMNFCLKAHGSKGVLSMVANSKADQLISAGLGIG